MEESVNISFAVKIKTRDIDRLLSKAKSTISNLLTSNVNNVVKSLL